jgi:enamine deaminase RidA (YjgF/YER057c/UK114 family)
MRQIFSLNLRPLMRACNVLLACHLRDEAWFTDIPLFFLRVHMCRRLMDHRLALYERLSDDQGPRVWE